MKLYGTAPIVDRQTCDLRIRWRASRSPAEIIRLLVNMQEIRNTASYSFIEPWTSDVGNSNTV